MKKKTSLTALTTILILTGLCGILPAQDEYIWKSMIAGGGGFVPGIIYHPSAQGLAYARTDMGGAYRWDKSAEKWIPLNDMMTRNNADYMGILSIALDPNDTNRVYLQCGKYTQSWAGNGAVLSSADQGDTWTIIPLPVKIGGNENGRGAGERLQVDPNQNSILFMGTTADGLWKSTNYGATWKKVSSFSPVNVNFVRFDPAGAEPGSPTQRLFTGVVNTSGQSLYRSDDGGTTWFPVPGQPADVMAIRSEIADTLLIMTASNSQGPNDATRGSVWKYGIPSGKWTDISPASGSYGFSGLSVYPKNPEILIVSTLDCWWPRDEVYLSVNGGETWKACLVNSQWDRSYAPYTAGVNPHWLATLVMDPFDSSKAMFGTGYGIWACEDLTASKPTWHFKVQNFEETVPMQIISPPFTHLLSAMGDYDGFRHDSLDTSPPSRYSPSRGTTLSIAFAGKVPSRIVKTFNTSPYGAWSDDGGTTWQNFRTSPKGASQGGTWAVAVSADGGSIVWGPPGASLSYSINDGKDWTACSGGVPLVPPVADRINPNKFYAYDAVSGRIWVSADGGKTFSQGAAGMPGVPSWSTQDGNLTAAPGKEGDLWICCGAGGLYRSTTSGASAQKVTGITEAYRLGFGRSSEAGGYPAVYFQGRAGGVLGIFRSDDTGASWTRINDDGHQFGWIHQVTGDLRVYGRCYVSAEGRGILYGQAENSEPDTHPDTFLIESVQKDSLDNITPEITVTWTQSADPQGNPLTHIMHFFGPGIDTALTTTGNTWTFSPGPVRPLSTYVLTGLVTNGSDTTASSSSIFFHTTSLTTDVGHLPAGMPARYALYPNYPNPFNPETTLSFALPKASYVRLNIFDVLGKDVGTIVSEKLSAGDYTCRWNALGLPAGVYFYRLKAGLFTETRKLILLR